MTQPWAYLDVHWLEAEAHAEEEDREDLVGVGRHLDVEVCKIQEVAGVQVEGAARVVQGHGEVLGPWGLANP